VPRLGREGNVSGGASGFGVQGSGFRVQGSGLRVQDLEERGGVAEVEKEVALPRVLRFFFFITLEPRNCNESKKDLQRELRGPITRVEKKTKTA